MKRGLAMGAWISNAAVFEMKQSIAKWVMK